MDNTESGNDNQSGLSGWIKLHRQIVDSAVFQDADLLRLWIWLLSKARHLPGYYRVESGKASTTVMLQIGDVIVGRNKTSQELGWKPDTYRDRLSRLEKMGMVTLRSTNLCTVVSVTNFQHFQRGHDDRDTNHQGNRTPTISEIGHQPLAEGKPSKNIDGTGVLRLDNTNHSAFSTPTGHQPDTNPTPLNKNVKNVKNVKKNTGFDPLTVELPEPMRTDACKAAWSEWCQHRKQISKPYTELACKKQLSAMNGWNEIRVIDSINYSILRGWQAIFEHRERNDATSQRSTGGVSASNAQMTRITAPIPVPPPEQPRLRQSLSPKS